MPTNFVKDSSSRPNHLSDYVNNVNSIHEKLGRIAQGKNDIAKSLSNAAAALRSIAALNNRSHNEKTHQALSQAGFL